MSLSLKDLIHLELEMGRGFRAVIADLKYMIFKEAVDMSGGNRSKAARLLKVHRNTVDRIMDNRGYWEKIDDTRINAVR